MAGARTVTEPGHCECRCRAFIEYGPQAMTQAILLDLIAELRSSTDYIDDQRTVDGIRASADRYEARLRQLTGDNP